MVVAALAEKTVVHHVMDVQLIQQRVTVLWILISRRRGFVVAPKRGLVKSSTHLGYGGREHNHLIQLSNTLHELIHAWPFDHINIVILAFNLHGNREVGTLENLQHELNRHPKRVSH